MWQKFRHWVECSSALDIKAASNIVISVPVGALVRFIGKEAVGWQRYEAFCFSAL
jgi:hypothetical protein